jgi:hypothetical protein
MTNKSLLTRNRAISAAVCVVLILGSALYMYFSFKSAGPTLAPPKRTYSSDDGQTHFSAATYDFAPCTLDGKEVMQAALYSDMAGKPFVAYLMKYTDEAKEFLKGHATDPDPNAPGGVLNRGTLVKRPGDGDWIPLSDKNATAIINPIDPATRAPLPPYAGN